MNQKSKAISWLESYQSDLIKIIGKYRKSHHALSVEEILSDVNNHFISKIIHKMNFQNSKDCKKFLYRMAIQFVKWTAKGSTSKDQKYFSHKVDSLVSSNIEDENIETVFDLAIHTMGEEDQYFKDLNKSNKYDNIKKWIFDYSDIITEQQKAVLPFVMRGKTLDEVGDALNITHQAVSALVLDAFDRIKRSIDISKSEKEILKKGNESIQYLFGNKRLKKRRNNYQKC